MNLPPRTDEQIMPVIGPPIREGFSRILNIGNDAAVERAIVIYRKYYRDGAMFEADVYPGIENLLKNLVTEGKFLFVATGKATDYALPILARFRLDHFFTKVYGTGMDGSMSDKKDLIAHILREQAIDPQDAVMIGDRHHDIFGARSNKVFSIGVLWGFGSRDELEKAGADLIIETPDELIQSALIF
jgi:phosphoglycolate phosphatase